MKQVMTLIAASTIAVAACQATPDALRNTDQQALTNQLAVNLQSLNLESRITDLQAKRPDVPGFAIALATLEGQGTGVSSNLGGLSERPFTAQTPVRIASVTKTFIAAAVLRLWEQNRIDLDSPLSQNLSPEYDQLLRGDGYVTHAITVRHVLMHAGGLGDHFGSDAFRARVFSDPRHVWTRDELLNVMVLEADPVGPPGGQFAYSDSGYILLGHIIEQVTGQALHMAVRRLTKLDDIGLATAVWDEIETPAADVPDRAHQIFQGMDTYDLHGSVDAFGGGGLTMSTAQMAQFYAALFSGKVFEDPATLKMMTDAPGHPANSPYRMGLFHFVADGQTTYMHGGFWGTHVMALPELGVAIAGTALDEAGTDDLRTVIFALARDMAAH